MCIHRLCCTNIILMSFQRTMLCSEKGEGNLDAFLMSSAVSTNCSNNRGRKTQESDTITCRLTIFYYSVTTGPDLEQKELLIIINSLI